MNLNFANGLLQNQVTANPGLWERRGYCPLISHVVLCGMSLEV
jgi:hypothetical protein